ncbi:MAG: hypothetical protein OZ934_04490 [Anaerolineae bacterium]|nr:hypothetical protein [Anaerolineae bacterium]
MFGDSNSDRRIFGAMALIALGAILLTGLGMWWPLFIVVPGLLLLLPAWYGGAAGAVLFAIPGMMVTGTGALLAAMAVTGYWQAWAYAWTLYGVFLGMAFLLMSRQLSNASLYTAGQGLVRASLIGFVAFGLFFELVIGIGIGGLGAPFGPLVLIALGFWLLMRSSGSRRRLAAREDDYGKLKRKAKRDEAALFTGPVIYGTRVRSRGAALSIPERDERD